MHIWHRPILRMYYYATYLPRVWRQRIAAQARRSPVMALFYHRVENDRANSWTTTTRLFQKQMHWLKANFDMVSLEEAQWRIKRGHNSRSCMTITFDDGYAANNVNALPLLVNERIPVTYFVTTRTVLDQTDLPHDIAIGQRSVLNTVEDLKHWRAAGVEIGVHSRTHADLGAVGDPDLMRDEIVTAREELEAALGGEARWFAFPYGQYCNLDPMAFHIAREANYQGVCSAYGGYNFPGDDSFHIQRFSAEHSMIRLKNWATLDPRHLRWARFDYAHARENTPIVSIPS